MVKLQCTQKDTKTLLQPEVSLGGKPHMWERGRKHDEALQLCWSQKLVSIF